MRDYNVHTGHLQSHFLDARRVFRLLLPNERPISEIPMMILLHGVHGSEVDWTEKADLQQTMNELSQLKGIGPIAVLMPSDGLFGIGTGYLNWDVGVPHAYESYLIEELIPFVEKEWKVGGCKGFRSISGLSMGGYASIRLGIKHPNLFSAASSLSGFFDVNELGVLIGRNHYNQIFLREANRSEMESPLQMPIQKELPLPQLLFDCGKDDAFLIQNKSFHERLHKLNIPHIYKEYSGGHNWEYWSKQIRSHLRFHYKSYNFFSF